MDWAKVRSIYRIMRAKMRDSQSVPPRSGTVAAAAATRGRIGSAPAANRCRLTPMTHFQSMRDIP
jgi:hypothetical protein